MSDHKFAVGQNVEFSPDWPIDDTTKGQYTVVALYPETGQYPAVSHQEQARRARTYGSGGQARPAAEFGTYQEQLGGDVQPVA